MRWLRALLIRLFCRNKKKVEDIPPVADFNIRDYLLQEDGFKIFLEDGLGFLLLETSEFNPGVTIENAGATTETSHYVICTRSGFKVRPGELIKDPYSGEMVLPEFADRDYRVGGGRSIKPRRSIRPEQTDRFITVAITTDDL